MNTFHEYQKEAIKTSNKMTEKEHYVLNGILGLNGESGELADVLKKHLFQGHELDQEKLIEELGDVLWYCALMAHGLGFDLSDVAHKNILKLRKRYGEKFSVDKSINRKEK